MLENFDFDLSIPEGKLPAAYLFLLVNILAQARTNEGHLIKIRSIIDQETIPEEIIANAELAKQNVVDEIRAYLSRFAE
jgi:hypothetical protein